MPFLNLFEVYMFKSKVIRISTAATQTVCNC